MSKKNKERYSNGGKAIVRKGGKKWMKAISDYAHGKITKRELAEIRKSIKGLSK